MSQYEQFIDITGANFHKAPLVRGGLRAVYDTGSGDVPETPAQIAAMAAAGMTPLTIDQTPGLVRFRLGQAEIGDIEHLAGTDVSAGQAVRERIAAGIRLHTLYVSQSGLPGLRSAVSGLAGVMYGVANYGWSLQQAQQLLAGNEDWAYAQYGDNITNSATLVPGTSVTCGEAGCDIDVCKESWAANFRREPSPVPSPSNWQEAMMQALPVVIPGSTNTVAVRRVQGLLVADGYDLGGTGPRRDGIDGVYGDKTISAVAAVQRAAKLSLIDSKVGPQTWPVLLGV